MVKKLTVGMFLDSFTALKELANKDVNIKTGVALAKNIKELNEILEVYNGSERKLFDKYGEKVDDVTTITEENVEVFNKERKALLEQEIDVIINTINVDDLKDINLKTSTVMSLDWLIEL